MSSLGLSFPSHVDTVRTEAEVRVLFHQDICQPGGEIARIGGRCLLKKPTIVLAQQLYTMSDRFQVCLHGALPRCLSWADMDVNTDIDFNIKCYISLNN